MFEVVAWKCPGWGAEKGSPGLGVEMECLEWGIERQCLEYHQLARHLADSGSPHDSVRVE